MRSSIVHIIQHFLKGIQALERIADLPRLRGRREHENFRLSYPPCLVRVLYTMRRQGGIHNKISTLILSGRFLFYNFQVIYDIKIDILHFFRRLCDRPPTPSHICLSLFCLWLISCPIF